MADFDNTNRFVLFKNANKRDDKDRDYNGTVNINGKDYWLNGYIKQSAKGAFISGTIKPKDASVMEQAAQPAQSISQRAMPKGPATTRGPQPSRDALKLNADMNDDIPF